MRAKIAFALMLLFLNIAVSARCTAISDCSSDDGSEVGSGPVKLEQVMADDQPIAIADMDIKQVMRDTMTKGLCQKVIKKKGTGEEQQQLLELFRRLAELDPPMGDLESWQKLTNDLVVNAEGIVAGKDNHQALAKAANCNGCHKTHRPK